MPSTRIQRRIMHRPEDLLELVADVERYPKFITFISALRVKDRKILPDGRETFDAEATVSYKFISERFHSQIIVDRDKKTISVNKSGHGGAVKKLKNNWAFQKLSDGSTLVDFYVDVSLKAFPLNILLREKFDKIGNEIMSLFEKKAGLAYEKTGDAELDWRAEKPVVS